MTDNLPAVTDNTLVMPNNSTWFDYEGVVYTVDNNKLYNPDHEVAVVYSPDFGGGWSTDIDSADPTDARVAVLTLTGVEARLTFIMWSDPVSILFKDRKFYMYDDTMHNDLAIAWVQPGTLFRITEYDGAESIKFNYQIEWRIA